MLSHSGFSPREPRVCASTISVFEMARERSQGIWDWSITLELLGLMVSAFIQFSCTFCGRKIDKWIGRGLFESERDDADDSGEDNNEMFEEAGEENGEDAVEEVDEEEEDADAEFD
jgi:hypothetical protein